MALSREWVCVRLASYENAEEAEFLTGIYPGRTGLLNNTTFALLAPDGKDLLARSGRGPSFTIDAPHNPDVPAAAEQTLAFAALLREKMAGFEPKAKVAGLPRSLDFRLALNVAACDGQPLVIAYAASEEDRHAIEARLARLAWHEAFIGRLQYAIIEDRAELEAIHSLPEGDFLAVVQADTFGQEGTVLGSAPFTAEEPKLQDMLRRGLAAHTVQQSSSREHTERGRRQGISWETELPVTDEKGAREGREAKPRRRDR